jgi:hypothetical protein
MKFLVRELVLILSAGVVGGLVTWLFNAPAWVAVIIGMLLMLGFEKKS